MCRISCILLAKASKNLNPGAGQRVDGTSFDDHGGDVIGIIQDDVFDLDLDENTIGDGKREPIRKHDRETLNSAHTKHCTVTLDLLMEMWLHHFHKRCKVGQLDEVSFRVSVYSSQLLWSLVLAFSLEPECNPSIIMVVSHPQIHSLQVAGIKYVSIF